MRHMIGDVTIAVGWGELRPVPLLVHVAASSLQNPKAVILAMANYLTHRVDGVYKMSPPGALPQT